MKKKKRVISAVLATTLSLSSASMTKANFQNNINKNISWQVNDYFLNTRLEQLKEQRDILYHEYIQSQIEILEYYHKLENPEFPTYNLSESEIIQIARLCQQEQYSLEGIAAEASLMANRFELCNSEFSSLISYIRNSGWFANANYFMDNGNARSEAVEIVRKVLVEGKRTIPKYVTEHDSVSDISSIHTGEVSDRNDYIPNETIISNIYGSDFIFYGYEGSSDPFGYKYYNKQNIGDEHYTYERVLNPLP